MRSSLYECRVMHHRFSPRRHRFVYGLFLFAIDLDELPALHRSLRCFSVGRRNVYSFREEDYFPSLSAEHNPEGDRTSRSTAGANLKDRVIAYLAERSIDLRGGRVVLVTLPRVLGYLFNPVSFYFCYDASGVAVATIAEVTNTFREVKLFLVSEITPSRAGNTPADETTPVFRGRQAKHFYVSPYSAVDVAFDFTLHPLGDRLSIQIDDYAGAERLLTSTLTGRRKPLTDRALLSATARHPLLSLKIISLIHWHALLLLLKRVPWFRKADRAADQRNLFRPHASIVSSP